MPTHSPLLLSSFSSSFLTFSHDITSQNQENKDEEEKNRNRQLEESKLQWKGSYGGVDRAKLKTLLEENHVDLFKIAEMLQQSRMQVFRDKIAGMS